MSVNTNCVGEKLSHKKTKINGKWVYRGFTQVKTRGGNFTTEENNEIFAGTEYGWKVAINQLLGN